MRFSKHVWIYAQRDAGVNAEFAGALSQKFKFACALYVEEQNSRVECQVHFRCSFAYSGENYAACCLLANAQNTFQLAAGNDVETCAIFCKQFENCER